MIPSTQVSRPASRPEGRTEKRQEPTPESRHARPPRELGELLLKAELITERQLREALNAQRKLRERLASVLVRQGVLTEKFAVGYLGKQLGVPAACLSRQAIDLGLLQLIPIEMCTEHMVFPIQIAGGRLVLAMKDPLDAELVARIERERQVKLQPNVALEVSLRHAMREAREALAAGRTRVTPDVHRALDPVPRAVGVKERVRGEVSFPVLKVEGVTRLETLAGGALGPEPGGGPIYEAAVAHAPDTRAAILLVEADTPERAVLARVLASRPAYKVVACASTRDALAQADDAKLVLVDGALKDGHALDFCTRLRSEFPKLPIVLLSSVARGWRFARDVEAALGLAAYIEKPVTARELLTRVGTLLGQPAPAAGGPEAARRHLEEGMAALLRNAYADAAAAFLRGLSVDPMSDLLHYHAGLALEKQGQPFEAMDHYEEATRLNPEFEDALALLAGLYERNGFRLKAIEVWQRALEITKDERTREKLMARVVEMLGAEPAVGSPSRAA